MSWTWRLNLFRKVSRLDNEFKEGINLSEALSKPQLLQAINEQSPQVVKYIIKHFKEIVDIATGSTSATDKKVDQCIEILTKSPVIKEKLCKSRELFNYVIETFSDSQLNFLPMLILLQGVVELSSGLCLQMIEDSTTFFQNLLNLLPNSAVNSFFLDLFGHTYKEVVNWSIDIEADKHLCDILFDEEPKMVCSLTILNKLVNIFPSKSEPMKRITSNEVLSNIFNVGIEAPTNEAAFAAFKLLVSICNQCDENEELGGVIEFLDSKAHQICAYIVNGRKFTKDKSSLCELLNAVITANPTLSNEPKETVAFLFDIFFDEQNKTNNFLHLNFFSIFETLAEMGDNFTEFVVSQNVIERLLRAEDERESDVVFASYWGFLTKMELMLKDTFKNNIEFNEFCNNKLLPRQEIIEKNYGGEVPKVKIILSDESDPENTFFGLSLSKLKNLDSSDSDEDDDDLNKIVIKQTNENEDDNENVKNDNDDNENDKNEDDNDDNENDKNDDDNDKNKDDNDNDKNDDDNDKNKDDNDNDKNDDDNDKNKDDNENDKNDDDNDKNKDDNENDKNDDNDKNKDDNENDKNKDDFE